MNLNPNGNEYVCAFCGTKHTDLEEYVTCVQKCAKLKREADEREKKAKLKEEKDERYKEVVEARTALNTAAKHYDSVLRKFNKDYGPVLFEGTFEELNSILENIFNF